jgi:hypothetical protein
MKEKSPYLKKRWRGSEKERKKRVVKLIKEIIID